MSGPSGQPRDWVGLLSRLEQLLASTSVVELDVRLGAERVRVRRATEAAEGRGEAPAGAVSAERVGLVAVVTPLAGTFYASPAPGHPPFVSVGDPVEAGQVVGLVEAMKMFNEIASEVSGTVKAVLASNGELLQAGQEILLVEPRV